MLRYINILKSHRFTLTDEKLLQAEIEQKFTEKNLPAKREFILSGNYGVIDFYDEHLKLGIEVKVKGSKREILKQVSRYLDCDQIDKVLLVTNKMLNIAESPIAGKCVIVFLGENWI